MRTSYGTLQIRDDFFLAISMRPLTIKLYLTPSPAKYAWVVVGLNDGMADRVAAGAPFLRPEGAGRGSPAAEDAQARGSADRLRYVLDLARGSNALDLEGRRDVVTMPVDLGSRIEGEVVHNFLRHFALTIGSHHAGAPSQRWVNCHSSIGVIKEWTTRLEFEPNLISSGGIFPQREAGEVFPDVPNEQRHDLIPGEAYGVVDPEREGRVIHSFLALPLWNAGKQFHYAVQGWGRPVVVADTDTIMAVHGGDRLVHLDHKPWDVGTDAWAARVYWMNGGGSDGRSAVKAEYEKKLETQHWYELAAEIIDRYYDERVPNVVDSRARRLREQLPLDASVVEEKVDELLSDVRRPAWGPGRARRDETLLEQMSPEIIIPLPSY